MKRIDHLARRILRMLSNPEEADESDEA